ncbi:TRAP transporter small permease [Consotaella salsifontis]|uniref:TRAP transporter small permease protein n=1 Tax=Consotaella salsifontis TaxID=1365950 RepID=A0A1T4TCY0_9HYPH|nr:TRAP transporter small permease [Consotaella salsifontis]SKA38069.1 TRAP-type C4-dicarboxylate transport system, small permease component [Consotaella salsifontis]
MDTTEPRSGRSGGIAGLYRGLIRFIAGTMMTAIVAIMVAQVVARYVFGSSLIWAEELCRYILVWMTFLLLGLSYQKGEFVTLEMFPGALPVTMRRILRIVMALPVLVFLAIVIWTGWIYASRFDTQTTPALDFIWGSLFGHPLHLSIRWIYVSVSVGAALLFLHILVDLALRFRRLLRREPDRADVMGTSGEIA